MAWHVKPSATTQIPTRDEPYLTKEMTAHYEKEIIPRYEQKMGAMMPILHDVQHNHGRPGQANGAQRSENHRHPTNRRRQYSRDAVSWPFGGVIARRRRAATGQGMCR